MILCYHLLLLSSFFFFGKLVKSDDASLDTCPEIVWREEFDGNTLDLKRWRVRVGDDCDEGWYMCGWGNMEDEYYTENNLEVSDGVLKIIANKDFWPDGNLRVTSGRIESVSENFPLPIYGRFEARMKFPVDNGIWPAFWMLPVQNKYGRWPRSGEIDIMENIGYQPALSESCVHWGNGLGKEHVYKHKKIQVLDGNLNDKFHTYAVEKEDKILRFLVDDNLFYTFYIDEIRKEFVWPFNEEFRFILNEAVRLKHIPDSVVFPKVMEVDYVRVYNQSTPSIIGPQRLHFFNKWHATFEIQQPFLESEFIWTIPSGSTVITGEGTNKITINFYSIEGISVISCTVKSPKCGEKVIRKYVNVLPGFEHYMNMLIMFVMSCLVYISLKRISFIKAKRPSRQTSSSSSLHVEFSEHNALVH